jgi:hypothetical protein
MGLDRWNEDRTDKPADYMVAKHAQKVEEVKVESPEAVEEEKPKRGRKPKKSEDEE